MASPNSGFAASEDAPSSAAGKGQARGGQQPGAIGAEPDVIRDAVAQLSDVQRAMIYRSHFLGRTTTQIAAELKTNDDAVKQELHHALHTLQMTVPGY